MNDCFLQVLVTWVNMLLTSSCKLVEIFFDGVCCFITKLLSGQRDKQPAILQQRTPEVEY